MVTTAISVIDVLYETLMNSRQTVDEVNKACADRGLPPAFPIGEDGIPQIPGNRDYQFKGFGVILGLPPKISFWVDYKADTPEYVDLGKFRIPISFGKFLNLKQLVG